MTSLWTWCLLLALVSLVVSQSDELVVDEATSTVDPELTSASHEESSVVVDDYLATLSDQDLAQICDDRGLEIASDGPLTRDDYLEGARRCLTLEDEMNAILAKHPDLAAELDKEIERMREAKEALEREREEMLAYKASLEQQLREAGVDIGSSLNETLSSPSTKVIPAADRAQVQTFEEVLKESLVLLYERVMLDVRFVQRILLPVLQPMGSALGVVWRYSRPTVQSAYHQARHRIAALRGGSSELPNSAASNTSNTTTTAAIETSK